MIAEELPDGRRQVQFGHAFDAHPKPTRHVETAPYSLVFRKRFERVIRELSTPFARQYRDVDRRFIASPCPLQLLGGDLF